MKTLECVEKKLREMDVDAYEIFSMDSHQMLAQAKDGEVELTEQAVEKGVAIRLFKKGKVSFGCSSDATEDGLKKVSQKAYEGLAFLKEEDVFDLPQGSDVSPVSKAGSISASLAFTEEDLSKAQETACILEKAAIQFDSRIRRVRDARFSQERRKVLLKNSQGFLGQSVWEMGELSIMVVAEGLAQQEMAWEEQSGTNLDGHAAQRVAHAACEKAVFQLGAKPVKTQRVPVVLDPVVVCSFLGVLSSSFLGDQVQKGRSAVADQLGKTIYSKEVTLVDDGTRLGGYLTFPFDGEGSLTRKNSVVSKGLLSQFLYDGRAAKRAACASTGNSIRPHFKETPRVGVTNFYLEPGKESLEDLFSQMGTGFWVRDVIGVHTADVVTGDFSLGASGVWIEKGKKQQPVRGVTLSGNLHTLFKKVVGVGEDLHFYRSFGAPPILIQQLDIGGT